MIVNFGCGSSPAPNQPGYINIDGSLTILLAKLPLPASAFGGRAEFVRVIRTSNIRYATARRLRLRASSLDGFYSSHAFEHLAPGECESLLVRIRSWLGSSGVLRVALPDLRRMAAAYVAGATDATRFVANTYLARGSLRWWEVLLGHSQHRWMYDAESFSNLLKRIGFHDVQECAFGQGRSPALSRLDLPGRQAESFYVEANK